MDMICHVFLLLFFEGIARGGSHYRMRVMEWMLVLVVLQGGGLDRVTPVGSYMDQTACIRAGRELSYLVRGHTSGVEVLVSCTAQGSPETGAEGRRG